MSRCHNGLPSKTFNGVHFAGKVCSAISVSLFANTKAFFTEQHDTHQLLIKIARHHFAITLHAITFFTCSLCLQSETRESDGKVNK